MKIGISACFLKPGQVGGAEFMLRGLLLGFSQIPDLELYVFIADNQIEWLKNLDSLNFSDRLIPVPLKLQKNRFLSESMIIPKLAHKLLLDVVIFPNYFTPWQLRKPKYLVVTAILDLNYRHFPEFFSWQKRLWLNLSHRITLRIANATVGISEFVRQDIANVYQTNRTLCAIPVPIDWHRFDTIHIPNPIHTQQFILSVANHYQHKNLATLVKAFALICHDFPDINLILVGQLPELLVGMRRDRCDDIAAMVRDLELEDRVNITGYISDAELAWYYRHAQLFAFPSVFEGFGIPPVEALGMGLPVLTTKCTAIPEVTMNLAKYVENPLNVNEWRDRLTQMLRNRGQYLPMENKVQEIRQAYAPVAIAMEYINLFRNIGRNMDR